MTDLDRVEVEGVPMDICYAMPDGAGPHPAMVVMYHRGGFDDFTKKIADDLAAAGYAAVAPDLYHWPPVVEPPEENPFPRDPEIAKDIAATLEWLGGKPEIDMERVGIIGHCMGGRMSLFGASVNLAFKSTVAYYSGNMWKPWSDDGPSPFDLMEGIQGPVAGFFGNDDKNPSPEDVDKIDAELTRLGIEHDFHRYDGAGHAFQNFLAEERYRPEATADSWAKTIAFLDRTLKG
jgi:carboxymethylenebutenolidase